MCTGQKKSKLLTSRTLLQVLSPKVNLHLPSEKPCIFLVVKQSKIAWTHTYFKLFFN
jgi:hypothetical protein